MTDKVNAAAVAWAVQIPCRLEVGGFLLRLAARAGEDSRCRRTMTKLCYEVQADVSTVRRLISYCEQVGALTRETRQGGPGTEQVLWVRTDVAPAVVFHAMEDTPYRPSNSRSGASVSNGQTLAPVRELGAKPSQETRAGNPRSDASVSETLAGNPRSDARVQLKDVRTPLTSSEKLLVKPDPLKAAAIPGGVGGNGTAAAALGEEEVSTLLERFSTRLGGEQDVRERIALFSGMCQHPDRPGLLFNYVLARLKEDAERPRGGPRSGQTQRAPATAVNGTARSTPSPFARIEAASRAASRPAPKEGDDATAF